jgi:hypothetical protein
MSLHRNSRASIPSAVGAHVCGAGVVPGVQVECTTVRTNWTPWAAAARLVRGDGRRDESPRSPRRTRGRQPVLVHRVPPDTRPVPDTPSTRRPIRPPRHSRTPRTRHRRRTLRGTHKGGGGAERFTRRRLRSSPTTTGRSTTTGIQATCPQDSWSHNRTTAIQKAAHSHKAAISTSRRTRLLIPSPRCLTPPRTMTGKHCLSASPDHDNQGPEKGHSPSPPTPGPRLPRSAPATTPRPEGAHLRLHHTALRPLRRRRPRRHRTGSLYPALPIVAVARRPTHPASAPTRPNRRGGPDAAQRRPSAGLSRCCTSLLHDTKEPRSG